MKELLGKIDSTCKINFENAAKDLQAILLHGGFNIACNPLWHVFDNEYAYTLCILLKESHFIVHTYPEYDCVYVNLFSCKQEPYNMDLVRLFDKVCDYWKCSKKNYKIIERL